jgi:hypothetical protein
MVHTVTKGRARDIRRGHPSRVDSTDREEAIFVLAGDGGGLRPQEKPAGILLRMAPVRTCSGWSQADRCLAGSSMRP